MKKITELASNALKHYEEFKRDNTQTMIIPINGMTGVIIQLHGNTIARMCGSSLVLSNCGYLTNTTKERLNGICKALGLNKYFTQKKGVWYFGNDVFNGEISINIKG